MPFVVDSSVTLSWCFADEMTEPVLAVQDRLQDDDAVVPAHWSLEVTNVLVLSERRGRITAQDKARLLAFLQSLPLQTDSETADQAFGDIAAMATTHQLTAYDAAYLELAYRLGVPLATLDGKLRTAAATLGISLLLS